MAINVLIEASGSLTSAYMIKAIQDAGFRAIASDVHPVCFASKLAEDYIQVPFANDTDLWSKMEEQILRHDVDIVIPSFDETLLGWGTRIEYFAQKNISIILSPIETLEIFCDKWKTYNFFMENDIPCPKTSLKKEYPLVKPIYGRGSQGVYITDDSSVNMEGQISQEVALGEEYTIDCFFDRSGQPIYIVPRKRMNVRDGKSTAGIVDMNEGVIKFIRQVAEKVTFKGPINFQCFIDGDRISFIEINPRIAGGMALGFAATENWIKLIKQNLLDGENIDPVPVRNGLKMERYYVESFIS